MNLKEINNLDLTKADYLRSLAINAVMASMAVDGRTLMTTADAARVNAIYMLLNLEAAPAVGVETPQEGQVSAAHQPKAHPALKDLEGRLATMLEQPKLVA